LECKKIAQSFH
jgi:isopenicillin N synthase-like dioxygenase